MRLYQRFLVLSRSKQIAIAVCFIHFTAILGLFIHHLGNRRQPSRPMVVKTFHVNAEQNIKAEALPVVTKSIKKTAPVQSKLPRKAKPVTKKKGITTPAKEKNLLKEIAGSLETLSSEPKKSRPILTLPPQLRPKAQIESKSDPSYGESLTAFLETALDLPEYGQVRAEIEIDQFGRLISCNILETRSLKNSEFLKTQLPNLIFPYFDDFGITDVSQTFTVVFRNVDR